MKIPSLSKELLYKTCVSCPVTPIKQAKIGLFFLYEREVVVINSNSSQPVRMKKGWRLKRQLKKLSTAANLYYQISW